MALSSSKKKTKKKAKKVSKKTQGSSAAKKKKASSSSKAKTSTSSKTPRVTVKVITAQIIAGDKIPTRGAKYRREMNGVAFNHCKTGGHLKNLGKLLGVTKQTIKVWRQQNLSFSDSIRDGYSLWLEKMPQQLIEHLSNGESYETFGAIINRKKTFLFALEKIYPEFADAKEIGMLKSQRVWEGMGMKGILGQHVTDLGEVPLMGNGKVIKDDDKKPMMVKKIVPARFAERTFNFMLQARFRDTYGPKDIDDGNELLDDLKEAIAEVNGETIGSDTNDDDQDL